jgi:hypothetical protein
LASSHNVRKRAKERRRQHCNTWEGTWIEPLCAAAVVAVAHASHHHAAAALNPQAARNPAVLPGPGQGRQPQQTAVELLCVISAHGSTSGLPLARSSGGRASSIRQVAFLVAVSSTTTVCSLQRSFSTCTTRRSDLHYTL